MLTEKIIRIKEKIKDKIMLKNDIIFSNKKQNQCWKKEIIFLDKRQNQCSKTEILVLEKRQNQC